jgi:hypothetical protein
MAAVVVIVAGGCVSSTPDIAGALQKVVHDRQVGCAENTGVGNGSVQAGTLKIGPIYFSGVISGALLPLETLKGGLLWYKSYIDIPRSHGQRLSVSVGSLTGGSVGLAWGTQSVSAPSSTVSPSTAAASSLHVRNLTLTLCGSSGGFPGGFLMTRPVCARVTVSTGDTRRNALLAFGGATCPVG